MPAQQVYSYNFITSPISTTTVKSGSGVLKSIAVTSMATGGIIAVYDSTSAASPIIASIAISGVAAAGGFEPYTIDFNDVAFATGLTIKTSGKAQNLTVSYR